MSAKYLTLKNAHHRGGEDFLWLSRIADYACGPVNTSPDALETYAASGSFLPLPLPSGESPARFVAKLPGYQ